MIPKDLAGESDRAVYFEIVDNILVKYTRKSKQSQIQSEMLKFLMYRISNIKYNKEYIEKISKHLNIYNIDASIFELIR